MRYGMLNEHKDLIGSTRAFDGSTLYLPIKITDTVRKRRYAHVYTIIKCICVFDNVTISILVNYMYMYIYNLNPFQ